MTAPLKPGATIGILGGGQLGRMLAASAAQLGFDVVIYCPETDTPAARVAARHICADYDDVESLIQFAGLCDAVTLEFENVPASAAEAIESAGVPVRPGAKSLACSQDRLTEKAF